MICILKLITPIRLLHHLMEQGLVREPILHFTIFNMMLPLMKWSYLSG